MSSGLATDPGMRERLMEERGGACEICGRTDWLQVHHILPRSFGGTDEPENLLLVCGSCHIGKVHQEWGAERGYLRLPDEYVAEAAACARPRPKAPEGVATYTVTEAARLCGVTCQAIGTWLVEGCLPSLAREHIDLLARTREEWRWRLEAEMGWRPPEAWLTRLMRQRGVWPWPKRGGWTTV